MENHNHLTSLTLTRYLPRLSSQIPHPEEPSNIPFDQTKLVQPNPKKIHGKNPIRVGLPGRNSQDLYRIQSHISDYEDVFFDRSWNFPKLKTDAQRLKKANQPYAYRKASSMRSGLLIRPHYIPVLEKMFKTRCSSLYCCDYCEKMKRDFFEEGKKAWTRDNLIEGREIAADKSWRLPFEDERDGRLVFGKLWRQLVEEVEAGQSLAVEGSVGDCEAVQRVGFGFEDVVRGEGQWEYQIKVKPPKRGRGKGRSSQGGTRDTSPTTSEEWVEGEDLGNSWALVRVAVETGSGNRNSDSDSYALLTPTSESVSDQWEMLSQGA
ncbi:uncharacterized protein PODANS_5_4585 [Podospora anserina S mat+]|uniref:Podospora anserina S mat+ genomic DNA chromosome 5, supercontig 5 n=1 Tax=Podospora anserina (strain S / ATCC MYA-4624 / DSM 980 / FGSC 10383) TaxID=515849 RepID=B2AMN1_PODAN|nr:uncharacterized protein PODANS_5_4585 [Podospora anserina S mat+]CAP65221.1 unnamed protein product [Podospora anserina S mat+]CDP29433.1 Putative protein of unknown function [Podospora anserina S mat+]